ncbi:MAG: DUF3786 domain-containing protein [Oscillospiraceae bacterium]|nr:DUF3786 domain-containing protein [Oscillospiraceae bacterium]
MPEKRESNYERQSRIWAEKFRGVDMRAVMGRLPEIRHEDGMYKIGYFGRTLAMAEPDMDIVALDDQPLDLNDKFNYYTLMWYCKDGAALSGTWVPFAQLRGASPFDPAYQKTLIRPFADTFSGKTEALRRGAQALGATMLPHSDVGFEVRSFDCIPLRCLFWDGDEEFPANANILFDASATDFIHVESVVTIAGAFFDHLSRAAGLEQKGVTF